MDFLQQIEQVMRRFEQPDLPRMRWLVALSGGADSTALLFAVHRLGLQVAAMHVNHSLRGEESDGDEKFCRDLCARLKIELFVQKVDSDSRDEATLRDLRYQALVHRARQSACAGILAAHTMDDQAETLLFRLLRGTSPAGLRGMSIERHLTDDLLLVRPLLNLRRTHVVAFLDGEKQSYRTDSSNLGNNYARNFIRNELLPQIRQRFGDVVPRLDRLRALVVDEQDVLEELTEVREAALFAREQGCPLIPFLSEPVAIQRRLLAGELRKRDIEVSAERIESLLQTAANSGVFSLDQRWEFVANDKFLQFRPREQSGKAGQTGGTETAEPGDVILNENGTTIVPYLNCAIFCGPAPIADVAEAQQFPPATADEALVDLNLVPRPIVVRRRQAGDVITPIGMKEQIKLKRYLQTHRKCDGSHAGYPTVLAHGSQVLWVPGVGLSDAVKVCDKPTHRLRFSLLAIDEPPIA